jgi:hypothetical protein
MNISVIKKVIVSVFIAALFLVPVSIVILQTNSKTAGAYNFYSFPRPYGSGSGMPMDYNPINTVSRSQGDQNCVNRYGKGYVLSGYYCVNPTKELLTCRSSNCENYTVKNQSTSNYLYGEYLLEGSDTNCGSGYAYNSSTKDCESVILYQGETCLYFDSPSCYKTDYSFDKNTRFGNYQEYNESNIIAPGEYLLENGSNGDSNNTNLYGEYLLENTLSYESETTPINYDYENYNYDTAYFDV